MEVCGNAQLSPIPAEEDVSTDPKIPDVPGLQSHAATTSDREEKPNSDLPMLNAGSVDRIQDRTAASEGMEPGTCTEWNGVKSPTQLSATPSVEAVADGDSKRSVAQGESRQNVASDGTDTLGLSTTPGKETVAIRDSKSSVSQERHRSPEAVEMDNHHSGADANVLGSAKKRKSGGVNVTVCGVPIKKVKRDKSRSTTFSANDLALPGTFRKHSK